METQKLDLLVEAINFIESLYPYGVLSPKTRCRLRRQGIFNYNQPGKQEFPSSTKRLSYTKKTQ